MEMLSAGKSQGIVGQSNQELRLFREMVNSYKNDGCEEMQKRMYHVMYGQFLTIFKANAMQKIGITQ